MKIDFSKTLSDTTGVDLLDAETKSPVSLWKVAHRALIFDHQLYFLKPEEKIERYNLAKILKEAEVELTVEQVALIKKAIGQCQSPMVVGSSFEILEG